MTNATANIISVSKQLIHVRQHRHAGATLAELLISLVIIAVLLTALAVAFDVAFDNYKTNQELADVSVLARNTVHRMRTTLRSAWNDPCQTDPYDGGIVVETDGMTCSLTTADGSGTIYAYDDETMQLNISIDDGDNWYALVDNVMPIATDEPIFTGTEADTTIFKPGTLERVRIQFRVQGENISLPISASVVPRNVLFH